MIALGTGYGAFRVVMTKRIGPPAVAPPGLEAYNGLGGWLILITIGLFIRVGLYLFHLATDYMSVWDATRWDILTVPGAARYDPFWAPTLLFELTSMIVFLTLTILALILLFQKRWLFPRIFIALLLLTLLFKIIDSAMAGQIAELAHQNSLLDTDFFGVIVQAVIWVPYMLYAKRVRATFRH
jgi:hypothetical protein